MDSWAPVETNQLFDAVQESLSSDEAVSADASNKQGQRPPSAAGSQTQPRPGSAYGSLPHAQSPAGSVGSRSNTPASLSGWS